MSLTLSGITLGSGLTLQPAFDPQINSYSVDVPSSVTSIDVTFRKSVYDTVWGFANAAADRQCSSPETAMYNIPGSPSAMVAGTWRPTATMLHADTYTGHVSFTDSFSSATSCVERINIYDGTVTKQTIITFKRVSA